MAISDGDRRDTARHEAAHVVVARLKGAKKIKAKLLDRPNRRGWGGWTQYDEANLSPTDEAVIILAGNAAAGKSHDDVKLARSLLRGTGVTFGQAQREAARLVREHGREIDRVAQRLYDKGRI